jgi:hypothetical protein
MSDLISATPGERKAFSAWLKLMDTSAMMLYILDNYAFSPLWPMTITIELPPEIEASFAALAAEQGMALPDYLQHLLEEQVPSRKAASLSPAERALIWRESAKGMPHTPPLSDEAIDRESFYDARG